MNKIFPQYDLQFLPQLFHVLSKIKDQNLTAVSCIQADHSSTSRAGEAMYYCKATVCECRHKTHSHYSLRSAYTSQLFNSAQYKSQFIQTF